MCILTSPYLTTGSTTRKGVGVAVRVAVAVRVGEAVAVAVRVGLAVAVRVAVIVGAAVGLAVLVGVTVGVFVGGYEYATTSAVKGSDAEMTTEPVNGLTICGSIER
jgi:hypothetical protein